MQNISFQSVTQNKLTKAAVVDVVIGRRKKMGKRDVKKHKKSSLPIKDQI
jgi:hypothetical protein